MSTEQVDVPEGMQLAEHVGDQALELVYLDENGDEALVEVGPGATVLVPLEGPMADVVRDEPALQVQQ